MSAVSSIYHVVINIYRRQMTIPDETCEHLYRYIWSIVKSRGCRLYRINGIGNHIHMLIELSPTKLRGPSTHLHGVSQQSRAFDPSSPFGVNSRIYNFFFIFVKLFGPVVASNA